MAELEPSKAKGLTPEEMGFTTAVEGTLNITLPDGTQQTIPTITGEASVLTDDVINRVGIGLSYPIEHASPGTRAALEGKVVIVNRVPGTRK